MKIGRILLDGKDRWISLENDGYHLLKGDNQFPWQHTSDDVLERIDEPAQLLAPVRNPCSIRDFFSFEGHVRNARSRRGLPVPPEWYKFPVFYFTNTNSLFGSGNVVPKPKSTRQMDFEAEFMVVIGKKGIDIPKSETMNYVYGISLANDWSARDVQMEEIKVGLGPAKGKDFALSMGPLILTGEEMASTIDGDSINLDLTVFINGKKFSSGNLNQVYWSYADMISRASEDCFLYPGDVIMSGTMENGCILESEPEKIPWLTKGDEVSLHSNMIGDLKNKIG